MANKTDTCAHQFCDCPARAQDGYCSDHCQQAATQQGVQQGARHTCDCGHPDCGMTVTVPVTA